MHKRRLLLYVLFVICCMFILPSGMTAKAADGTVEKEISKATDKFYYGSSHFDNYASEQTLIINANVPESDCTYFEKANLLKVRTLIIAEGVTDVSSQIFSSMYNLERIVISSTYSYMGGNINTNEACKEFVVDSHNATLSVFLHALYSKDQTKLIAWPKAYQTEELTLPSSLQNLNLESIPCASMVKKITIPKSLYSVGNLALCTNLEQFSIEPGAEYFSIYESGLYNKEKNVLYGYPAKIQGNRIIVCNKVRNLDCRLLKANTYATTWILPNKLINLTYPESSSSLKEICLSSNNSYMKVQNGVLYNKKMTRLMIYPSGRKNKTYTIPGTVREANNIASKYIRKINIPAATRSFLKENYYLPKLQSVTVSRSNLYYAGKSDVLYNKRMTHIELYPQNKKAKKYVVPDTVLYINGTLKNNNLREVTLGRKVSSINKDFYTSSLPKLQAVYVTNTNRNYRSDKGVLYTKKGQLLYYPVGKKDTSYTMLSTVNKVNSDAFEQGNPYLETLTLSDSLEAELAVESVKFPCLKNISISDDNEVMTSIDGVLYSKNLTTMLVYPMQKKSEEFVIPDEVINVDSDDLCHNRNLMRIAVTIKNTYFYVMNDALYSNLDYHICAAPGGITLKELWIGKDITYVNNNLTDGTIPVEKYTVEAGNAYYYTDASGRLCEREQ